MVIYSFYIFDRHTECIYSKTWLPPPSVPGATPQQQYDAPMISTTGAAVNSASDPHQHSNPNALRSGRSAVSAANKASDDAKLIFGTVFSLRNMVRKLGGEDDAFISYRTAQYKLHYYETASNLRFVMLTDTGTLSMRNVMHQIYINLWCEYVVKNPLSPVEHKGGAGVRNELFELGLNQFITGLIGRTGSQ
ncbi:Longin-like domain-containing protein [Pseudoneurospora amorphoporcata]|uniref:Trafficking protein particle complex subunit n=1 Tax=Pseudoneurospora amorphoporcata TaxID=241081 RepID=A0AAN6NRU3_9PEZI|nr:Longin-like domain-containing protein [Pseudoneurospora amorphoporcata]